MNSRQLGRLAALGSAVTLGTLVASFASCATNADADPAEEDASSTLPDSSPAEIESGLAEAGCDASDPSCIQELVPCETVAWCLVPMGVGASDTLTAVWGTSRNDVWAVGSGGTIVHHDGTGWTATPSGVFNTLLAVWGSGPNDVWAVSSTRVILHSTGFTDGKATWTNVPARDEEYLIRTVWGSSPDDVRIAGWDPWNFPRANQFVKTTLADGGVPWRALSGKYSEVTYEVTSIWGSSGADVWMTADNSVDLDFGVPHERGLIFHGTPSDGGVDAGGAADSLTWARVDSESSHRLEALWGSSGSDVWAVGVHGTIRHLSAGDERWQPIDSPTTETLRGVWGSGPNDVWLVGDGATILHYDGTKIEPTSTQLPTGQKPNLRAVWGSSADDVWIVGDGAALHYTGRKPGIGG